MSAAAIKQQITVLRREVESIDRKIEALKRAKDDRRTKLSRLDAELIQSSAPALSLHACLS